MARGDNYPLRDGLKKISYIVTESEKTKITKAAKKLNVSMSQLITDSLKAQQVL